MIMYIFNIYIIDLVDVRGEFFHAVFAFLLIFRRSFLRKTLRFLAKKSRNNNKTIAKVKKSGVNSSFLIKKNRQMTTKMTTKRV